jgi:aspartate carbamoyltransferase regulatory subunit
VGTVIQNAFKCLFENRFTQNDHPCEPTMMQPEPEQKCRYKCDICDEEFTGESDVDRHLGIIDP